MADNRIRILATLDDKVSSSLDKMRDRFDTMGKSKGFQSIVQGVGLGIGASAWRAAKDQIVDVLGAAIAAAREEEVSIQKLGTSLKANVPAWDGNTAAIERKLKAQMALGFSDDEQRDSLAKLVAATHDVTKAQDIQRTAMDLARFKGISLAEATDALTKVEAGSFRILKSLGIELKNGATQTEALAAVQRVAAGQAEDYANTNEGKLLVSQVKVNEAMEELGAVGLPIVVAGMQTAADVATDYATVLHGLTHATELTSEEQQDLGGTLVDLGRRAFLPAELAARGFEAGLDAMGISIKEIGPATDQMAGKVADDAAVIVDASGKMGDASTDWRDTYFDKTGDIMRRTERVRDKLIDSAKQMSDGFFDPLQTRADIFDAHQAALAAIEDSRLAKTKRQHRDAATSIIASLDDQADGLDDLSAQGVITEKDVDKFEKDVKASYRALGQAVPAELQRIIDKYRIIAQLRPLTINLSVNGTRKSDKDSHGPGKGNLEFEAAHGGVVPGRKGEPMIILAHGGETVIPTGQSTYGLSPLPSAGRASGGGGGGETRIIQLVVSGRVLAEIIDRENGYAMDRAVPAVTR